MVVAPTRKSRLSLDGLKSVFKTRSPERGRALWWIAVLVPALALSALGVRATTAPAPGHTFPKEFLEFKAQHPEMFEIKGGLEGMVERARMRRQTLIPDPSKFHVDPVTAKIITEFGEVEPATVAVAGTVLMPVIPVLFTPNSAPVPPTAARINQILFTGPNPPWGTAHDYYNEVSYGLLNLTGTVFPYTTLPSAAAVYQGGTNGLPSSGGQGNVKVGKLMKDALDVRDPIENFGLFDNDGPDGIANSGDDDGLVDLVSFIHPQRGGECGGAEIWAHRWFYSSWFNAPYTTNDAWTGHLGQFIRIDSYNIQGALTCTNAEMDIGTFCHETGHIFGLPDLYDTGSAAPSAGVGSWSLMASGNWNTQESPAHMSIWEKTELGWLVPTLLTSPQANVSIPQVETNARGLHVAIGNGEVFLIENRQAVGFDRNLLGCGLAIWQVDYGVIAGQTPSNTVNNFQNCGAFVQATNQHYGLALEQADGLCDLEAYLNFGDAGDLYPGSTVNRNFTGATNPDSDSYYSGGTNVRVTNISNCANTMVADVDAFANASAAGPVDVVFLIDNTGSYFDDWPNIQAQMPSIVTELTSNFANIRFGLALFRDFPFSPYGSGGDSAYQVELPLSANNSAAFLNAVASMQAPSGGNDVPESQYEALHQLLFGLGRDLYGNGINGDQPGEIAPSSMGWLPARHRVVYLLTDADFHNSDVENYPTGTTDVPTPTLEAAGRNFVRGQLVTLAGKLTLFTLVAENPGVYVSQGEDGSIPNLPPTQLQQQAQELAEITHGGVFSVGSNSAGLLDAIVISIDVAHDTPMSGNCNTTNIVINDLAPASPYPSSIDAGGTSGMVISDLAVTLDGFTHTFPDDVDVLLVGPAGEKVMLMSDAGGSAGVNNLEVTFSDTAGPAPDEGTLTQRSYRPTDYSGNDGASENLPGGAPPRPYGASLSSAFKGKDPNGTWSLYVNDDEGGDVGSIARGWCLSQRLATRFCSDISINIPDSGQATPYPANLVVSGIVGTVTDVRVTLQSLTHTYPSDLDVMVVPPASGGRKLYLMSDAGDGNPGVSNLTLTFDANLGFPFIPSGPIVPSTGSTTLRPADYSTVGESIPVAGFPTTLTMPGAFNTTDPNGTWQLYVFDDAPADVGTIAQYCVEILTTACGTPPIASVVPQLRVGKSGSTAGLTWTVNDPGVSQYDIVLGDLLTLRSSGGDFTSATAGCLGLDLEATAVDDPTLPGAGQGRWYLVSATSCSGAVTYDSGSPSQVGSRDAEIRGALAACP